MQDFKIDSQKLVYHPQRVARWLGGQNIYPVYIEVAPYGGCNHRCRFCALDYLGYRPRRLDSKVLKRFIRDAAAKGVKSIMFAGEGEPLLHEDLPRLVSYAGSRGLDVAMTTNGVLLTRAICEQILPSLSWLRISLNAGTAKTYAFLHGTHPKDFDRVLSNIKEAVRLKKNQGHSCTIGVQLLLLNENRKEVGLLADILKGMGGVSYLIIKPYSQHPLSLNRFESGLNYKRLLSLEEGLKKYDGKNFKIIFRKNAMLNTLARKTYGKCLGFPFWAYLSSKGELYACSAFLGDKRFCYGNIHQKSFVQLWKSRKKKAIEAMMEKTWNIEDCRQACRLDEINKYLWRLKQPPLHVNFI